MVGWMGGRRPTDGQTATDALDRWFNGWMGDLMNGWTDGRQTLHEESSISERRINDQDFVTQYAC